MEDIHKIGGIPAILKYLLNNTDLIDGSQLTVTGKTLAENLVDVAELEFRTQDVFRPLNNPIKPTGHLTILRGNLAPETAVAKLTGKEGLRFDVSLILISENKVQDLIRNRVSRNASMVWMCFMICSEREKSKLAWSLFSGIKGLRVHQVCRKC